MKVSPRHNPFQDPPESTDHAAVGGSLETAAGDALEAWVTKEDQLPTDTK